MPATLVVVVLGYGACSSGSPSMLDEHGQEARHVAAVWWLMFGLAAAVYVIVAAFIFVALLRGRRTDAGKPSRFKDDTFIWIGGSARPCVVPCLPATLEVATSP